MIFWKKKSAPEPELTNEAYARWLRAFRPPFEWFLGLPADEQEQLALIGDEHRKDSALAVGWAVRDPQAASAGVGAARGDQDAEVSLVQRIAAQALAKMAAGAQKPAASKKPPPPAMRPTGRKV